MFSRLIAKIETKIRNIESGLCDKPPSTYDKFREQVGKRNGLLEVLDLINEITRETDEY